MCVVRDLSHKLIKMSVTNPFTKKERKTGNYIWKDKTKDNKKHYLIELDLPSTGVNFIDIRLFTIYNFFIKRIVRMAIWEI